MSMSYLSLATHLCHSFPTRRSSDLHAVVPRSDVLGLAAPNLSLGEARLRGPRDPLAERRQRPAGHHLLVVAVTEVAGPDRKSTRLNSSHLVISYAVFCLKKTTYIHI